MSDLLHKDVPILFIWQVFEVMRRAHWHRFQVLTKRGERLEEVDAQVEWPANVWWASAWRTLSTLTGSTISGKPGQR